MLQLKQWLVSDVPKGREFTRVLYRSGAVAVPLAVAHFTVMVWALGAERVTVRTASGVALLPSLIARSLMLSEGGPSSLRKIGRASGRERVEISVVAGSLKKKKSKSVG